MSVTYPNRVIDKLTHGKSSSAYIKTFRGNPEPIGCIASGDIPLSLTGLEMFQGSSITMTVAGTDGVFKTITLNEPEEVLNIFVGGVDKTGGEGSLQIDPRTIITLNPTTENSSLCFLSSLVFLQIVVGMAPIPDELKFKISEFYIDVFGEIPNVEQPENLILHTLGIGTDGIVVGKTKSWNVLDLYTEMMSELSGTDMPDFTVVNTESKLTIKSSGEQDTFYNDIIQHNGQSQLSVNSCVKLAPKTSPFTCIPTVKTFKPTVSPVLNDGYAAVVLKVVYTVEYMNDGQIDTDDYHKYIIITNNPEDNFFYNYERFPNSDIYEISDEIDAATTFKMLFSVSPPEDLSPLPLTIEDMNGSEAYHATNKIYNVSGIGTNRTCHILSEYDAANDLGTIAGIFDPLATDPPPRFNAEYMLKTNVPGYIYGHRQVTSVKFEEVDTMLPYYAKCYVTEQFGEDVTLQSCLGLSCGGGSQNV